MTAMMQAGSVAGQRVECPVREAAPAAPAMTVNSVRLPAELEARLLAVAGRLGMRKSDVIRQALEELLAREEAVARARAQAEFARSLECAPQALPPLHEAV